ncbi:methyltransferase [Dyella sp. GSA-30]|uniref:methyltransferase n=1 Tax=Dyella sp. GSA-30 TaxID=2994496 RepID=UPI0024924350|nr:methyltransferase [Dyella sp. GSA-30]BDU21160.1 methyltransferase [Dyella sp. GSA-30]
MSHLAQATIDESATVEMPPHYALLQMITGYWVTQALYVVAKLGVPDALVAGPRPVEEIASATASQPDLLRRLLRALSSIGVFTEAQPGAYALTPMASLLRTDVPNSMRPQAIMHGEEQYRAWIDTLHNVKTGETAFEKQFGTSYFGYLAGAPEADRVFNEAQAGYTREVAGAVVDAYDFSGAGTVIDVGAGYGPLLTTILKRNPGVKGILFDQPHVATAAGDLLSKAGVSDRCVAQGGDFFASVPAGGDIYILSLLLHDWNDERSATILRHCRRAIEPNGKLLIVELVLPDGEAPFFGKWLDLHMAILLGARERTATEFQVLLSSCGFQINRILSTPTGMSIVEAVPI